MPETLYRRLKKITAGEESEASDTDVLVTFSGGWYRGLREKDRETLRRLYGNHEFDNAPYVYRYLQTQHGLDVVVVVRSTRRRRNASARQRSHD